MTRRFALLLSALALIVPTFAACTTSGGNSRTIEVDYHSDEFAGTFRGYYPRNVTVRPGMTVKFHQTWTGEPHSVTFGTEVQRLADPLIPTIEERAPREPTDEDAVTLGLEEEVGAFFETLPFFFGEKGVNQAVGQPCYLTKGLPPKSGKRCTERAKPEFTGKHSYYSSGFIPYLGERGNEFEMKIANNTDPGEYFYYCTLHGPAMSGKVIVTNDEDIPSQAEVNRQGKKEADAVAKPLITQLKKEQAGDGDYAGNLAGSGAEATAGVLGQVNEFTPRTVQAKVGEPVEWTFILAHTISFNVPPYVPWYDVEPDGTVTESAEIYEPRGGWPGRTPPIPEELEGPDAGQSLPAVTIAAPDFDGTGGLKSSGTDWQTGDKYSVTFRKKGTYPMACLVHPGMIGKVVVS